MPVFATVNSVKVPFITKKLASVNKSAVGLGNNTKLCNNEKLTEYNNKLAFKCRKIKMVFLIHSFFARDSVIYIKKRDGVKSEKLPT